MLPSLLKNPMTVDGIPQDPSVEISPDTQAIVEQKMPNASDDVKQRTMVLMETIKQRSQTDLKPDHSWNDEAYLKAVDAIQQHLAKSKALSEKYEAELEQLLHLLEEEVQQYWQSLTQHANRLSHRLRQTADNTWIISNPVESVTSNISSEGNS